MFSCFVPSILKTHLIRINVLSTALVMSGVLIGCGGGGGGGGGGPGPGPGPDPSPSPSPSLAGSAPVISCQEDTKNTVDGGDPANYLTQPATQIACAQTLLDFTFTASRDGKTYVAGFAGTPKATLTETSIYRLAGDNFDRYIYSTKVWDESGSTGNVGELWWGRQGSDLDSRHVAVGQSTIARQVAYYTKSLNPQAAIALIQGQRSPFPTTAEMRYEQIDATKPTYSGGSGGAAGRGPVLPGTVSGAVLLVQPVKPMSGALTMNIEVDGHTLLRTLPLRANVKTGFPSDLNNPDLVWSMKAAPAVGSNADCKDSRGDVSDDCFFPAETATSGTRRYQAATKFFGASGEYAVVRYSINVDSPPAKLTSNSRGEGLIVLKRLN